MKIGFIVNPIAGMGGKVALKGTDGVVEEAIRRGARPVAGDVARLFLQELRHFEESSDIEFLTGAGPLGADALGEFGFDFKVVGRDFVPYTTMEGIRIPLTDSGDTKRLVSEMLGDVSLIVFAGGDGTARDVYSVTEDRLPILGIPTGVKMFSGVFAASPEDAARVVAAFVRGDARIERREVMDLDEDSFRRDVVRPKRYGRALVPYVELLIQGSKEPQRADDGEDVDAMARAVAGEILEEDGVYFLGAGSTVKRIKDLIGIDGTLLGVDVVEVSGGKAHLAVKDASEEDLLRFVHRNPRIVVTVIGGLSFLFGRGNQQFSADVLRHIPRENILVVAAPSKLEGGIIRVYTGDREVDEKLRGYMRVRVSPWMEKMVRVA